MKWLRRHTTECESEARRILTELDRHNVVNHWERQACMERILEELTAPRMEYMPENQLNTAIGDALNLRVTLVSHNHSQHTKMIVEMPPGSHHYWPVEAPSQNLAVCIAALHSWHAQKREAEHQARMEKAFGPLVEDDGGEPAERAHGAADE